MLKVLELFSGYGSQALALENLGLDFTSDISEIDKYAIDAYNQIHGQTKNYGDICGIDEGALPEYDLVTYSSPCQDFSIAGLQRGGGQGFRYSFLSALGMRTNHPRRKAEVSADGKRKEPRRKEVSALL